MIHEWTVERVIETLETKVKEKLNSSSSLFNFSYIGSQGPVFQNLTLIT